jgi:hypothetical protein
MDRGELECGDHGAILRVARQTAGEIDLVVCCDMWAIYLDAIRLHLPHTHVVFD